MRFIYPVFTSIGGMAWLQGRHLISQLGRLGSEIEGTVVDLGCGASPFRQLFPKAAHYLRIDRYAVDHAVIVSDATELPLENYSVDCVLLAQVIGDVRDLVGLFREIARVLAPDGRALVYETMCYPQHDMPNDCWRVLPAGLKWAVGEAGLQVSEFHRLGGYYAQWGMHWNIFIVGNLGGWQVTRPLAWMLRAGANLMFAALDAIRPQPNYATDYFACIVKSGSIRNMP